MFDFSIRLARIAARNAWRRRRLYAFVLMMAALFSACFVLMTGIGDSFARNLESRALAYYGGHFTILTTQSKDGAPTERALPSALVKERLARFGAKVSLRNVYRKSGTEVLYQGTGTRARMLVGIDWDDGGETVQALDFERMPGKLDDDSILVPESFARKAGLTEGVSVKLLTQTMSGQRNTANLRVDGIFKDDPVFSGGIFYLRLSRLNAIVAAPQDYGTDFSVWMPSAGADAGVVYIRKALADVTPLWDYPVTKQQFLSEQRGAAWTGERTAVFSLADQVRDLNQALLALRVAFGAVLALLLAVFAFGLAGILRVILFQRTREIGGVRALGMQIRDVVTYLSIEVATVAGIGSVSGCAAGYASLFLLSNVNLDRFALIRSLLKGGDISYELSFFPAFLAFFLCVAAGVLAGRPQAAKTARKSPAQALAEGSR